MRRLKLCVLIYAMCAGSAAFDIQEQEWPTQSYITSPLHAPLLNITKQGKTEPGYIFFTPTPVKRGQDKHGTATIVDNDGELIWQSSSHNTTGLRPQRLRGEDVLTYWEGERPANGAWIGSVVILNQSYDEMHRVTLGAEEGYRTGPSQSHVHSFIDMHESVITEQGSLLVTAANSTMFDLRSVGGAEDGRILDYLVYEIDIATNNVVYRWKASDHLPMSASYAQGPKGLEGHGSWDYVHLNSVAPFSKGIVVSSRMYHSIIAIDRMGNVLWKLEGQTGGDFTLGPGTQFRWQHDARIIDETGDTITLSLFNNNNIESDHGLSTSTCLVLHVDIQNRTVSLARRVFDAADRVSSMSQGNCQTLSNGHLLIGYGATPKFKEYDEHGAQIMAAQFGVSKDDHAAIDSYRVFRSTWTGRPRTLPSVAACLLDNRVIVYVSWNGATDVTQWEVSLGWYGRDLRHVHTAPKNGFETRIDLGQRDPGMSQVRVTAVGGPGDGVQSEIVSVEDCQ
ncbi:ASST-domain-containing protein [Aspergillus unguis]